MLFPQCCHYDPPVGTRNDDPRIHGFDQPLLFMIHRSGEHRPDDLNAAFSCLRAYLFAGFDHYLMFGLAWQSQRMCEVERTKHNRINPRYPYDLVDRLKRFGRFQ